jgi:hypothetical protein
MGCLGLDLDFCGNSKYDGQKWGDPQVLWIFSYFFHPNQPIIEPFFIWHRHVVKTFTPRIDRRPGLRGVRRWVVLRLRGLDTSFNSIWVNFITTATEPWNHGFFLGNHPLLWPQDSG